VYKNNSESGLNHILNVVKACDHTNVILLNDPHRYDLIKSSCVNKEVTRFNRKVAKCTKLYEYCTLVDVDLNKESFAKHGVHLNGLGNHVIVRQLVCHICDKLFKVASTPIGLRWKNDISNQDLERNSFPDEMESCVEVSNQTILNLDHPSQNPVLNSINFVANRSSNRIRRTPVTRNRDFFMMTQSPGPIKFACRLKPRSLGIIVA
jgi:hypothetical protein